MSNAKVRLACGPYDRTNALVHGLVKLTGMDLEVIEMNETAQMFRRMIRGEYDASEMSLAELVYQTSRGDCDFIGIPVFPSRVFRHGFIYYNARSNIQSPRDLEGKKIGFSNLIQTASVWIRGMLFEEFDISPEKTSLHVAALGHSIDAKREAKTRDGSALNLLDKQGKNDADTLGLALQQGLVDVIGTTRVARGFGTDRCIKRLFEDYRQAELAYFKRTQIFPIMHVVVLQQSAIEKQPDLPTRLFDLFSEAKQWAYRWRRNPSSLSLVWHGSYLEEEQRIFAGDPWVYGLEENAHVIEKFLSYCYDLGISERRIEPKDLFAPSTWALREQTGLTA